MYPRNAINANTTNSLGRISPILNCGMTALHLRIFATLWVALLLLIGAILNRARRKARRPGISFVIDDLSSLAVAGAWMSLVFVIMMWFFDEYKILHTLFWEVLFLPFFLLLTYLPKALMPVDLLSRLRYGRPKLIVKPIHPADCFPERPIMVAHLADLHLTVTRTLVGGLTRITVHERAKEALSWAHEQSDMILLTGDITDRGESAEWDEFLDVIESIGCRLDSGKVFLVPGNHDLSLVTQLVLGGAELMIACEKQAFNYVTKVLLNGPRNWMMMNNGAFISVRDHLESVIEYLSCYEKNPPYTTFTPVGASLPALDLAFPPALVEATTNFGREPWPTRDSMLCGDFIRLAYPMLLRRDDEFAIVGLNSCDYHPGSILNSGFGRLGSTQTKRFAELSRTLKARSLFILLHHHLSIPQPTLDVLRSQKGRVYLRSLSLLDGYRFAGLLRKMAGSVVFHGHKHMGYRALLGDVTLISGPSVAYGDSLGRSNCSIYAIAPKGEVLFIADHPYRGHDQRSPVGVE
jgi:3',5'-cyclic AMP phosphodiesterase CpdA